MKKNVKKYNKRKGLYILVPSIIVCAVLCLYIGIKFFNKDNKDNKVTQVNHENVAENKIENIYKKDSTYKDNSNKNNTNKDNINKDTTNKDTTNKETTNKEDIDSQENIEKHATATNDSNNTELESVEEKKVIVIDAGHQAKGNSEKEPIGPGAKEVKPKVSSGTQGIKTRIPEYKINLEVALKLEKILQDKGYEVIMVRTTNEVNISNSERAAVANDHKADAFVRIHCNGSDNHKISGALTMCQTKNNTYCGELYDQSHALADYILKALCEKTGAKKQGIIETDTMSGINWCKVPVTIVEMGYMTNEEEDELLSTDKYQEKLAVGIADGIESYLNAQ